MNRLTVAVVAALVLLAGAAVPVSGQTNTVTLTVTVVDQSGAQVGGVTLEATWDGGSSTARTASNGKAFLDVEEGADVEIDVNASSHVRNTPFLVEDASERELTVPVYKKGSVTVQVSDSGGDLDGAQVTVSQGQLVVASGRTNADGVFESGTIQQGSYTISVVKRGYYRNTTDLRVDGNVETQLQLTSGSVTYDFLVTDPHFDPAEPVGEATLSLATIGSFKTLPNGQATARVPVNARIPVTVSKDAYDDTMATLTVGETSGELNLSVSRAPNVTLSAANQRVVAGERLIVTATDEYGDPIEGADIVLDGESVGATDANGQLAVPIETPGEHTLSARDRGVDSDPVRVTAISTATETATETPTPTTSEEGPSGVSAPGFTPALVVLAFAAFALLARRSRL